MVHTHGYSYCSDCKVAYKPKRPNLSLLPQDLNRETFPMPKKYKRRSLQIPNLKGISISINNSQIRMLENNINVEMQFGNQIDITERGYEKSNRAKCTNGYICLI